MCFIYIICYCSYYKLYTITYVLTGVVTRKGQILLRGKGFVLSIWELSNYYYLCSSGGHYPESRSLSLTQNTYTYATHMDMKHDICTTHIDMKHEMHMQIDMKREKNTHTIDIDIKYTYPYRPGGRCPESRAKAFRTPLARHIHGFRCIVLPPHPTAHSAPNSLPHQAPRCHQY